MIGAVQETLCQQPPYVQILNATGTAFVFSSYLGANANAQALYTIAVNAAGETYLGGTTNSANAASAQFPDRFRLVNAFQTVYGGGDGDAVIQKLGFSRRPLADQAGQCRDAPPRTERHLHAAGGEPQRRSGLGRGRHRQPAGRSRVRLLHAPTSPASAAGRATTAR